MAVTNPTIATALGKIVFGVKETTRGVYNSAVYTGSNALFLNAPAIPDQALRKVFSRQQRNTFSRINHIPVGYGKGALSLDVPIKPSGALGTAPHGDQVLEGWWGKKTIVASTSVEYTPFAPAVGTLFPSFTYLVKYGHEVFLLIGSIVETGNINGVSDGSENVIAAWTGSLGFLRMYWIGKDELSGTEATGQSTISVKNAKKFYYGFSSSPAVAMKVAFRTVAGVVDDNSGAGYTLTGVDIGANTIGISPNLAGAGLAANDIVYPFVPTPVDSGVEVGFHLGGLQHGVSGSETDLTVISMNYTMNNPFVKILENEKSGAGYPYPTRIVDAGGNAALREAMAEIEFVSDENDTDLRYISEQQTAYVLKGYWGNVAGSRFYIKLNQSQLEAPVRSGDQEIHTNVVYQALGTGAGNNEASMMFD